jgi:glycosyltransferase involved in cell wall biosynthesis
MSESRLVSVVIPSYNHAEFVGTCIDSILTQTYRNLEVIVIDDGSTDDTRERMKEYGDKIRYVYHDNRGRGATRNRGIELAQGEWIAFVDADDIWRRDKLEKQMAAIEKYPEIDLIVTDCCQFDGDEIVQARFFDKMERIHNAPRKIDGTLQIFTEMLFPLMIRENFIIQSSVLMRKSCFDKGELYDNSLKRCQDRDLWMRLSRHFTFALIDEVLTDQRKHSLTDGAGFAQPIEYRIKMFEKALARMTEWETKYEKELKLELARTHYELGYFYYSRENNVAEYRKHLTAAIANGYSSPRIYLQYLSAFIPRSVHLLLKALKSKLAGG